MELRQLEYFLECAHRGSLTKAAEALYTTQPHVSQVIRALERELGAALFRRTGSGIVLTEDGERIRFYAENAVKNAALIRETAADGSGETLRIAANPSSRLAVLTEEFFCGGAAEGMTLQYTECSVEQMMELLEHRQYDLGFLFVPEHKRAAFGHLAQKRHLEFLPLLQSDLVLHCGPASPFYGRERVTPEELDGLACVQMEDDFFSVTMPCPICHEPIVFDKYNIDNIGPFHCVGCGFGVAQNNYQAHDIDFENKTFTVDGVKYDFKYSTPYFLYCYVAALALAREFNVPEEKISEAFEDFVNIGGRMETIEAGGKSIKYLRMKQENPETVQSALNVIADDPTEKLFLLGLDELVDFEPHYTNTFYTFDCDFRRLINSNVERCICFSGTVAYDAALRMLYDGFDPDKLTVLPTNDDKTIVEEMAKYDIDNVYLITWLHKFESLAAYAKAHI